jgi:hypothetical protein
MLVLDGIVASSAWQQNRDGATISFLLGAPWFVNAVGTAWLLTWMLVKAMGKIAYIQGQQDELTGMEGSVLYDPDRSGAVAGGQRAR